MFCANVCYKVCFEWFIYIYNPDSPCFNVDSDIVYFNERYEQNECSILFDELNLRL